MSKKTTKKHYQKYTFSAQDGIPAVIVEASNQENAFKKYQDVIKKHLPPKKTT